MFMLLFNSFWFDVGIEHWKISCLLFSGFDIRSQDIGSFKTQLP